LKLGACCRWRIARWVPNRVTPKGVLKPHDGERGGVDGRSEPSHAEGRLETCGSSSLANLFVVQDVPNRVTPKGVLKHNPGVILFDVSFIMFRTESRRRAS